MIRRSKSLSILLALTLAACGGGGNDAVAPVDNGMTAEADLPIDTPVYEGDTPTAIDAAAKNPAATPLAPDTPVGGNATEAQPYEAAGNAL